MNTRSRSMPPRREIRLIAMDLDGTLLDDGKRIPPENLVAIRRCAARGVKIVLASGRMTPSVEPVAAELGVETFIISYNGAVVCAPATEGRRRLLHSPLPSDIAGELIEFGLRRRYMFNFYHDDRVYGPAAPDLRPFAELYSARTGARYELLDDFSILKGIAPSKFLYVTSPEEREKLRDEMLEPFGKRCSIVRTDPEYLEFLAPGVDKGSALSALLTMLRLRKENAMAIGDGENDIPLLEAAGLPVAMANASPECLSRAEWVTGRDNSNGGVAEAIERFLF